MTEHDTEGGTVRPFADWLREQSGGKTHAELSESLRDLVSRVQDTGKKGTLVLSIVVEPMKGDSDVLVLTDNITLKLPEFPRASSIYYADEDHNLRREDPKQPPITGLQVLPGRDEQEPVRRLGTDDQ